MLVSLHVKNLALIDETEVFFKEGLTILSGETGAGKSIIIGSINLALGARADKDLIRNGAEYALVELVFTVQTQEQKDKILAMDIPLEEDGTVFIQRKIMANRTVCKVCGEMATTKMLKELAEILIDIHGQHEHQSLLSRKKQMEILDNFCKEELAPILTDLESVYHTYHMLLNKLEETCVDEAKREREISLAEYEVQEIEAIQLELAEDEQLETSYKKMVNAKKIKESVHAAYAYAGYEQGAGELLGRAVRELKTVSVFDEELRDLEVQVEELDNMLNDVNRALSDYASGLEFEEEEFAKTEERLNQINHLKAKYGTSIEEILEYQKKQQEYLERLLDLDTYKQKLEQEVKETKEQLQILCEQASIIRKKEAQALQKQMKDALLDLNFMSVQFEILVTTKPTFTEIGNDEVEFMISLNVGEPIKPLVNVASGGELSRIMLALKTVLAKKDEIDTLIFDEIDTGISGKTAWKVSEKLGYLAHTHQIICITHLPQIAAMADSHFVIAKSTDGQTTMTTITQMPEEDTLKELARMLGGEQITETVLLNAKEMKELARKTKKY